MSYHDEADDNFIDVTYNSEKQDDCDAFTPPVNNNCLLLTSPCADIFPKSKSELAKESDAPSARILFWDGEKKTCNFNQSNRDGFMYVDQMYIQSRQQCG